MIHAAWRHGVERLLFLGSSCIYPRLAPQPMREDALLTGTLEPTNEPYAIAKIAGIKLCESYNRQYGTDFRSVMPTNLYGPGDNFDLANSHVIPALMRNSTRPRSGAHPRSASGAPAPRGGSSCTSTTWPPPASTSWSCRRGLPAPHRAHASHINVGTGQDVSIGELAELIARGRLPGRAAFDPSKPDGAPRKLLDVSRLSTGLAVADRAAAGV